MRQTPPPLLHRMLIGPTDHDGTIAAAALLVLTVLLVYGLLR